MSFSQQIKQSINGDEYYTPQNAVDMIIPYIMRGGYKTIWCPFDKADSKFVTTLKDMGFDVNYGHIEMGQNFFNYQVPQGEYQNIDPPYICSECGHSNLIKTNYCEQCGAKMESEG